MDGKGSKNEKDQGRRSGRAVSGVGWGGLFQVLILPLNGWMTLE